MGRPKGWDYLFSVNWKCKIKEEAKKTFLQKVKALMEASGAITRGERGPKGS